MRVNKMQARINSYISKQIRYGDDPESSPTLLKGKRNGNCNRTACQAPGAFWWNRGSHSWYCTDCALMLSRANNHDEFCKDEPLCKLDAEAMNEWTSGNELEDKWAKRYATTISDQLCAK